MKKDQEPHHLRIVAVVDGNSQPQYAHHVELRYEHRDTDTIMRMMIRRLVLASSRTTTPANIDMIGNTTAPTMKEFVASVINELEVQFFETLTSESTILAGRRELTFEADRRNPDYSPFIPAHITWRLVIRPDTTLHEAQNNSASTIIGANAEEAIQLLQNMKSDSSRGTVVISCDKHTFETLDPLLTQLEKVCPATIKRP